MAGRHVNGKGESAVTPPKTICPLDRVASFIRRFAMLSPAQLTVVTLWVAHTHALDAADTTPYLSITSAEKQCGKTRLLEVLSLIVAKPWLTGSVSKAVLIRKLDAEQPTLLLDESDAAFAGDREYSEALRAVLNFGHSRDGVASLCVGQGTSIQFKDFRVFCPKAIAGIGKVPDTVADRSIPIRMRRRLPTEGVERFRRRHLSTDANDIRTDLANWTARIIQQLRSAAPALPESLSDRQQDGCEPLLAIADVAGGDWPGRARTALLEILTGEAAEDDSIGVRLLDGIRSVFENGGIERISTADLLAALCDIEPQWLEFSHGKPISPASLARLLKRYGIHSRKLRLDGGTLQGYLRESFADAITRYLPRHLEQVEQSSNDAVETQFTDLEQVSAVPDRKARENAVNTRVVPGVPDRCPNSEPRKHCHIHGVDTTWWERSLGDSVCERCHPRLFTSAPSAKEIGFH